MSTEITMLDMDLIRPNKEQPRKHFSGIVELSESIEANGLQQPIVVRPIDEGYEIIAGQRRFMACRLLGRKSIEAIVRTGIDDRTAYELAIVENAQREGLTPMEEADAFKRLQDEGFTQQKIAGIIGKSQSYVAHKLRLLSLPEFLTVYLRNGLLTENHLRQIQRLKGIYPPGLKQSHVTAPAPEAVGGIIKDTTDATYMLIRLQPEDCSPPFKAGPEQMESCRLFWDYVSKHNADVEQWLLAALWYAALASNDMSVSDLSTAIDRFQERYHDAIHQWYDGLCWGPPKAGDRLKEKLEEILGYWTDDKKREYWGFRADLRHGGSLNLDVETPGPIRDWYEDIVLRLADNPTYCLPTSMQRQFGQVVRRATLTFDGTGAWIEIPDTDDAEE